MPDNQKAMTLRLPEDQASTLEAVAQVNGVTVAEEVRKAIQTENQGFKRAAEAA